MLYVVLEGFNYEDRLLVAGEVKDLPEMPHLHGKYLRPATPEEAKAYRKTKHKEE